MRKLIALAAISLLALTSCAVTAPVPFPTPTPRADLPGEPLTEEMLEGLPKVIRYSYPRRVTHPNGNQEIWWDIEVAINLDVQGVLPGCPPKDWPTPASGEPTPIPRVECQHMPGSIAIGPGRNFGLPDSLN